MMKKYLMYWWRLISSPTRINELLSMELLGAWEPSNREGELVEIVRAKDPSVVFIAETWTDEVRLDRVQSSLKFQNRWVVPSDNRGGGLILFWKDTIILSWKIQIGTLLMLGLIKTRIEEPNTARRHEAWSELRRLNHHPAVPWICMGDFNEIVS